MYSVYKHTTPNNKVYIGITSRKPEERWENGKGYKRNVYFYRAIKKYGWENIRHEIIYNGLTKNEAEEKEVELIAFYNSTDPNSGYNFREGGATCSFSEISLKKMRMSHLGKKLPNEQKQKISKSLKGRTPSNGMLGHKHSEETKLLMSKKRKGIKLSEDTKNAISKNRKGLCKGSKNKRSRMIRNVETGEIFETITQACKKYSLSHGDISSVCLGKRKTCGGYHWQYASERGE